MRILTTFWHWLCFYVKELFYTLIQKNLSSFHRYTHVLGTLQRELKNPSINNSQKVLPFIVLFSSLFIVSLVVIILTFSFDTSRRGGQSLIRGSLSWTPKARGAWGAVAGRRGRGMSPTCCYSGPRLGWSRSSGPWRCLPVNRYPFVRTLPLYI